VVKRLLESIVVAVGVCFLIGAYAVVGLIAVVMLGVGAICRLKL